MTRRRPTGTLPPGHGEPERDEETFRLRVLSRTAGPSHDGSPDGRTRNRSRSRSRIRRRRRQRRRTAGLAVLAMTLVAGAALLVARPWQEAGGPAAATPAEARTAPEEKPAQPSKPPVSPSPSASPSASPTPSPSASAETGPPRPEDVPAYGPGTFTVAREGATGSGRGSAYRVEVEDGTGVDPDRAAEVIAAILADPRGWSHDGAHAFRQVSDSSAGMVIRIATPATTDRICGQYGLNTGGEVNCRGGEKVMVNLRRWLLGSPQFDGPVAEYQALIINHEVGHWLGRGHETCPGPGRPAPAMMQQIKGLKGCVANAWPYDRRGRYLGGPSVP
ncbi:DUF3152 domain-containing protein [Streptomyces pratensis]|uniref:DUF3152 domain-containing protein n=1 Tax=Streptomyces pratensis TaxID=1169025 RepID=UPI003018764B